MEKPWVSRESQDEDFFSQDMHSFYLNMSIFWEEGPTAFLKSQRSLWQKEKKNN